MPKVSRPRDATEIMDAPTLHPSFLIDIGHSVGLGNSINKKPEHGNLLVGRCVPHGIRKIYFMPPASLSLTSRNNLQVPSQISGPHPSLQILPALC
ncbi:hypothetical protein HBI56_043720 [Parastagonospora nodorum]|uniref:Uncharacterized protein n=1 Tax=Phaeosphaeria nodorum (strain SN15 / ATCC MYA-4574 / FGSC 10173) TaxID=321614 RepID=A0A7U2EU80_PHANO|nr:hypothetical protein HBH56_242630 [Parastagonospora nodorum]QRC93084.1 hypothetical protein JI435_033280 [Parastagonospora nodorum SN15]KAH3921143.1 hypothetical protein HBH54_245210 [Parastagonospora nodorum]KAH3986279.1 hypothetical protein HBH52_040560 [Parastagonospora nodorum]KAH3988345.1 hypothetical protein HBH51_008470 [Parastagonospora nodorum]